jgi:o-succinylbenzoate---CoA ligase
MTRPLVVVDSRDPAAVLEALRRALAGGPAVLPHPGEPGGVPAEVPQRVAVIVETSGSTGRPKRVALSADALLASAAAAESRLGGPGQWLLALPAHYIAGVNVLVRSIASGTEPVVLDPEHFTAERFADAAAGLGEPRRYTSLVPTQLARLVAAESDLDAVRRLDAMLVGGQAMPADLLARAIEAGFAVIRTYGSSETSGGCVWDGLPIGDTAIRIGGDGRVEVSGSVLADGYLGDPERTAAAFVDGWFRTDDTGSIRADGVLSVNGRADDVIVSGGVKVSLAEVELAIRNLPGLEDAVVASAPDAEWGERPVVVATATADPDALRRATAHLGPAATPARVLVLATIPLLPSGKPDRRAIAAAVLG